MTGMQNCGRQPQFCRLVQQPLLDRGLANSIIPKRLARLLLARRYRHTVPVHPNGSAVQQMNSLSPQGIRKMLRAVQLVAGKINDSFGIERSDRFSKRAGFFCGNAIQIAIGHHAPCWMVSIRLSPATADASYGVTVLNKHGSEIAADMANSADSSNSHMPFPSRPALAGIRSSLQPFICLRLT
jgi:hypothetical protein